MYPKLESPANGVGPFDLPAHERLNPMMANSTLHSTNSSPKFSGSLHTASNARGALPAAVSNSAAQPLSSSLSASQPVAPSSLSLSMGLAPVQNSAQLPATKHTVPFNGLSFHNPFDVNSYPLTNPPLYDPTMILPYGAPGATRRRRISISNGQIGQIVNHEAFFIDDDLMDDYYDTELMYRQHLGSHHNNQHLLQAQQHQPQAQAQQPPAQQAQEDEAPSSNYNAENLNGRSSYAASSAVVPNRGATSQMSGNYASISQDYQHGREFNRQTQGALNLESSAVVNPVLVPNSSSQDLLPMAGMPPPNHSLIYNNEVIYNPHDGPIPGTAAWKKERLLERNRVAASKCRQRKKHAQQQLQNNVTRYQKDLQEAHAKVAVYENLILQYNSALERHFSGDPDALDTLRGLVTKLAKGVKKESD